MKAKIFIYLLPLLVVISMASCVNPFAPGVVESPNEKPLLGDQKTVEGVFKNFSYAYMFKDTVVYGRLLADDFVFVFRDYDKGADISWGREEDMVSTYRLFNASQSLEIIWNNVVQPVGDSLLVEVSRGFTLTIVFSPTDVVRIQGRTNFRLKRPTSADPWLISSWRDESNY